MTRIAALLAAAAAVLPAAPGAAEDSRIATRLFDPAHVVTLTGRADIQSTIEFADDERIENVAVGDSAAWQVTPNKRASLLFVKPMAAPRRTNMTVVTDKRTYLFDLVASARAAPVYVLRFTYPRVAAPPAPLRKPPAPEVEAVVLAKAEAAVPEPSPADLDFGWQQAGAKGLWPQRVFDDGRSTWLSWSRDTTLPAILQRAADGGEGPVNYTVRGDYLVVDGVPSQIVLRQGKEMATLTPAPDRVTRPAPPPPPLPGARAAQTASAAQ